MECAGQVSNSEKNSIYPDSDAETILIKVKPFAGAACREVDPNCLFRKKNSKVAISQSLGNECSTPREGLRKRRPHVACCQTSPDSLYATYLQMHFKRINSEVRRTPVR